MLNPGQPSQGDGFGSAHSNRHNLGRAQGTRDKGLNVAGRCLTAVEQYKNTLAQRTDEYNKYVEECNKTVEEWQAILNMQQQKSDETIKQLYNLLHTTNEGAAEAIMKNADIAKEDAEKKIQEMQKNHISRTEQRRARVAKMLELGQYIPEEGAKKLTRQRGNTGAAAAEAAAALAAEEDAAAAEAPADGRAKLGGRKRKKTKKRRRKRKKKRKKTKKKK